MTDEKRSVLSFETHQVKLNT